MTSVIDTRPGTGRGRPPDPAPPAPEAGRPEPAGSPALRGDAVKAVARGLTGFGLLVLTFLVWLVAITPLQQGRDQRGLEATFREYLATQQAWIGGDIPEGEPVAQLRIPSIGVEEIVVEGTSGSELRKGPGHLRTSALPGQAGNAVVAGRKWSYGAPFRRLGQLRRDDLIITTTGQVEARYRVVEVVEVARDDDDVVDPTNDDRLTLVTSSRFPRNDRRLAVVAELRGQPVPTVAARPDELRTDELGLHGDRSQGWALVLWLQALVAAVLATVWLRRRWSRWSTWLVAAPVLALLLLLVFDSLAPVLPSTL